jgi:hypothetical protein
MEAGLGSSETPPLRRHYLKVLVLGDAGVGKTVRFVCVSHSSPTSLGVRCGGGDGGRKTARLPLARHTVLNRRPRDGFWPPGLVQAGPAGSFQRPAEFVCVRTASRCSMSRRCWSSL